MTVHQYSHCWSLNWCPCFGMRFVFVFCPWTLRVPQLSASKTCAICYQQIHHHLNIGQCCDFHYFSAFAWFFVREWVLQGLHNQICQVQPYSVWAYSFALLFRLLTNCLYFCHSDESWYNMFIISANTLAKMKSDSIFHTKLMQEIQEIQEYVCKKQALFKLPAK